MYNDELIKTDKLKIAIGETVISFQFIENDLAYFIGKLLLLKEDKDVHRISAAMSFKQKVDFFCEIYPTRRWKNWPEMNIKAVKNSLVAAEEFRNSVVHSFWYVSGKRKIVWMRSKGSLRSKAGLNHVDGIADIRALEQGVEALKKIRDWYLGKTEELITETTKIKKLTKKLTRQVKFSAEQ
jgi:hypothetical protein